MGLLLNQSQWPEKHSVLIGPRLLHTWTEDGDRLVPLGERVALAERVLGTAKAKLEASFHVEQGQLVHRGV